LVGEIDVVAVGHVLVDIRFRVQRFPNPDEEAKIIDESRGVGGSAANVAIAVRRLGLRSSVIAKVGLDSFARIAVDSLIRERVDISGLKVEPAYPTGFSVVVRDPNGRIIIYGFKGASERLGIKDIDIELVKRAKYVHIASLRLDTTKYLVKISKEYGRRVSWDPGRVLAAEGMERLREVIKDVDIVLANEKEAGLITHQKSFKEAARIIKDLGPRLVVIKRGEKGSYVISNGEEYEVPAYPVPKVIDTTGAGDAFAAGLISSLIYNYPLENALKRASIIAALKVSKLGSHSAPTLGELTEYIRSHGIEI